MLCCAGARRIGMKDAVVDRGEAGARVAVSRGPVRC